MANSLPSGKFFMLFFCLLIFFKIFFLLKFSFRNNIWVSKRVDPDQARHFVRPGLGPICLQRWWADDPSRQRVKVDCRINFGWTDGETDRRTKIWPDNTKTVCHQPLSCDIMNTLELRVVHNNIPNFDHHLLSSALFCWSFSPSH